MNLLRTLERRLSGFALPHLTLAILGVQTLTFLVAVSNPAIVSDMVLDTQRVMAGEWWRLLTFLMLPPTLSPLWLFFAFYLFYMMGTALEEAWGSFRYNLFWLIGYVASVIAAFIVPGYVVDNGYLTGSVLLAFAMLYPDFEILLFFILPVKIKWIALLTGLVYGVTLAMGIADGNWGAVVMIGAAVANFFAFFGFEVVRRLRSGHRRMQRQRDAIIEREQTLHCCVTCGRTERSDPRLEFRYSRQGDVVVCHCLDHLPKTARSEA